MRTGDARKEIMHKRTVANKARKILTSLCGAVPRPSFTPMAYGEAAPAAGSKSRLASSAMLQSMLSPGPP